MTVSKSLRRFRWSRSLDNQHRMLGTDAFGEVKQESHGVFPPLVSRFPQCVQNCCGMTMRMFLCRPTPRRGIRDRFLFLPFAF